MNSATGFRHMLAGGLALALVFAVQTAAAAPGTVGENSLTRDMAAPVIDHKYRQKVRIQSGTPVEITAQIIDDDGVKEVTLYYRTVGGEEYVRDTMQDRGEGKYAVLIPGEAVRAPGIEYYIQAEDKVGNMSFKGATFSPIQLVVKGGAPQGAVVSVSGVDDDDTGGGNMFAGEKKWWWIAGGVLLTGAAYAASQGDDKDKDSGESTITITGRNP